MSKSKAVTLMFALALAAGGALGEDTERGASAATTPERAAAGWIERGFARLERAIARLEAKLSGRGGGGCEDMMGGGMMDGGMMGGGMMGGGMMGGARPNERWRQPDRR
ncbi:MAG: hypothetical protein AB1452_02950 [Pseudomonadota bacterium]